MAKGPGGTRSGNSGNPSGNGGARVNASRTSQLEIEDRIIALEGERQRAIYAGDFDRRDEINAEIKALREQYRQAGEPETPETPSRQEPSVGAPVKMPSMPKKDTGTRATVRFGEDTYEISHYSTGYGNDKRTNGTFNVAINGRGLTRFDYGPGPYRAYKNAREAYEAIKKFLRKRDSNNQ